MAPSIPTFKELGAGDVDGTIVYTLLAPAGTPPAIVARLNEALNAAVSTTEQKEDLSKRGFVAMGGSPQATRRLAEGPGADLGAGAPGGGDQAGVGVSDWTGPGSESIRVTTASA